MGAAGASDPGTVSLANAILYLCFAIFGYCGGTFFNLFGPRITCTVGSLTYAFYAICVYLSGNDENWSQSLFLFSAALLGCGAGWLWTAQGAIMLSYPPEEKKASYISEFWVIFNIGGLLGGILMFALNFNAESSSVANPVSYFVFVAIMTCGSFMALILIVSPSKVIREDGEPVFMQPQQTFLVELRNALLVVNDRNMVFLFPLFFASNFFYPYVFNTQTIQFNIRTRGINSAVFWGSQMVGAVIFGKVVDRIAVRGKRAQAVTGFIMVVVSQTIGWVLGAYLQFGYLGGFEKNMHREPLIDVGTTQYVYPFFVYLFYGLSDSLLQTFAYWLMSTIGGADTCLLARYSGYYKGVQSLGAGIAWLLDSSVVTISYSKQYWICVVLFIVGSVACIPVIFSSTTTNREYKGECNEDPAAVASV